MQLSVIFFNFFMRNRLKVIEVIAVNFNHKAGICCQTGFLLVSEKITFAIDFVELAKEETKKILFC